MVINLTSKLDWMMGNKIHWKELDPIKRNFTSKTWKRLYVASNKVSNRQLSELKNQIETQVCNKFIF